MSTSTSLSPSRAPSAATAPAYRTGLVVLGVLSLLDLTAPLTTDGETPPMSIALIGAALGAATVGLVALAWRGSRGAALGVVAVRLFSALTAVPAFFVDDIPTGIVVLAGIGIAVTVVGVVLVLTGLRRPATEDAR